MRAFNRLSIAKILEVTELLVLFAIGNGYRKLSNIFIGF